MSHAILRLGVLVTIGYGTVFGQGGPSTPERLQRSSVRGLDQADYELLHGVYGLLYDAASNPKSTVPCDEQFVRVISYLKSKVGDFVGDRTDPLYVPILLTGIVGCEDVAKSRGRRNLAQFRERLDSLNRDGRFGDGPVSFEGVPDGLLVQFTLSDKGTEAGLFISANAASVFIRQKGLRRDIPRIAIREIRFSSLDKMRVSRTMRDLYHTSYRTSTPARVQLKNGERLQGFILPHEDLNALLAHPDRMKAIRLNSDGKLLALMLSEVERVDFLE
jgi:hypothetical protein